MPSPYLDRPRRSLADALRELIALREADLALAREPADRARIADRLAVLRAALQGAEQS